MTGRAADRHELAESLSRPDGDCAAIATGGQLRGELAARAARARVPLAAQVELTARCNLRCVHCYVGDERFAAGDDELSLERLLTLVDELADAGCMMFTLTGGEMALREGWLRIIEAARGRRMVVTVLTNGTCLTAADARHLAALKVKEVAISLYGDTAALHDRLTGVPGSFARSLAAIGHLRDAGVPVRVSMVLMTENFDRFDAVRRLAEDIGCSYRFDPTVRPRSDGDRGPLAHRVPATDIYHLFSDEVVGPRTAEGKLAAVRARVLPPDMTNSCAGGFSVVFIDATGGVYACPGFLPGFGDVRERSFASVWRGAAAEEHRRAMERPVQGCRGCDLRRYCLSRCPRLAAIEDGSVSGPSTRACEMARAVQSLCEADASQSCELATAGVVARTSVGD